MSKRQKRGCLLVLVGLSMVFAAMGLHLVQEQQDAMAGESAHILLTHLELSRSSVLTAAQTPAPTASGAMPIKEYMGYAMIGTIRIPSLEINLPVLNDWSYPLLDISPCRYSGSVTDGNLIIMGHNYKSHFTPLHWAGIGADVEFENVNGQVYDYRIAEIVILHKNEAEKLNSAYPLTLFTCTDSGQKRIVVRCEATE